MYGHENSGLAIGLNQPKLTTFLRSLSAPTMDGTGTESSTLKAFGPANSRALVSPGWPAATPSMLTLLLSLGLLGSARNSIGECSVTAVRLSGLSGIKTAPKYEVLTPIQL